MYIKTTYTAKILLSIFWYAALP